MIKNLVTTLGVLCNQTEKLPMKLICKQTGYSKSGVEWHIRQLMELGLLLDDRRTPTFEPPYDPETLTARVILHTAIREAEDIPWLRDQLATVTEGIGKTPEPVLDRAWLRSRLAALLAETDDPR